MNIANQCDISYKQSKNQRLQVELALLKMSHLQSVFNIASVPLPEQVTAPNGELKKKLDTTVNATPEPVQDDVPVMRDTPITYNKTPTVKSPAPENKPVTIAELTEAPPADKPKPFIANVHSTTTSVKIPSLKDLTKKLEEAALEEEDPYLKGDDKQPFTIDEFLQLWTNHGAKLKAEGKPATLYTIFTSITPLVLSPENFEVLVSNKIQEMAFRDERPYLLNFLRTSLKNFSIEVNARVEETTTVRKPYTAAEKFQYMAAKNPQLIDLKNRFNLEFD
jgi:DNA polymerase-3 subunit gamma/tau